MATLYADENFPLVVVDLLRSHGQDVLTAFEAGQANQGIGDQDVLAFAIAQGRAVLTLNRHHFIRLHRRVQGHSGILVCTDDRDRPRQARKIDAAVAACPNLGGQLIRVYRGP